MFKLNLVTTILVFFFFSSCATQLPVAEGIPDISKADYTDLMQNKSVKEEIYSGLYNQVTAHATRLDASAQESYLAYSARLYQWSKSQYDQEKSKVATKQSQSSEFFLSFYTPERKHNDLSSSKSMWKIYLDVEGQRYEGSAVRLKQNVNELETMYPAHNRWSTPYLISFPIAAALLDGKPAKVTITGAISTVQLQFKN